MKEMTRTNPWLVAATRSGAGKNTIATGLIRVLKEDGQDPVPFKPLTIEQFAEEAHGDITPSIQIQSIAAMVSPNWRMNPLRVIFPTDSEQEPAAFLHGRRLRSPSLLPESAELEALFYSSFLEIQQQGLSTVVIEGSGALADWVDTPAAALVDRLNPHIVLVVDCLAGGGFASAVGTLELIPPTWRQLIRVVIFNQLMCAVNEPPLVEWGRYLSDKYGVSRIGAIPTLTSVEPACEDTWPLASQRSIEVSIKALAVAVRGCVPSCTFTC